MPDPLNNPRLASLFKLGGEHSKLKRYLKIALGWGLALLVALALQRYAFKSYEVFGQSMQPTLNEGDYLIISKLPSTLAGVRRQDYLPHRGEIVVLESPLDDTRLIKRVIGLPGERISVANGTIRVYNTEHPRGFDPYAQLNLPSVYASGQISVIVPEHNIFVVGDNRASGGSLDSRNELGTVPSKNIVGKVVVRLWPLSKISNF